MSTSSSVRVIDTEAAATKRINAVVEKARELTRTIKAFDKERSTALKEIKEYMGDDVEELFSYDSDELLATWKHCTVDQFDTAAFKEVHPGLFKKFTVRKEKRTFLLK